MPVIIHPAWSGSKIPPKTLNKINNLSGESRRVYLSDLIANYTQKTDNVEAVARRSTANWIDRQKEHLRNVISELNDILDMELGHPPSHHEVEDDITS